MKGKLIVIDGTDGSGKATQTKKLASRLRREGIKVVVQDFPRYKRKSSFFVRDYLNGKLGTALENGPYRASVFYALDRFAAAPEIREAIDSGVYVVSNRYVSANMGHQAGKIKNLRERDKFLDWIDNFEFGIFGIPRPDLQILLYAKPEIAQKLVDKKGHRKYVGGRKRDIHEADIGHLRDASKAYSYCAKKFNWKVVDCTPDGVMRSEGDIHEDVYDIVSGFLKD